MTDEQYLTSEIEIKNELLSFFKQNANITIFDIGSCEGLDSIRYKKLFSNAKIYAFEPLTGNIELIKENLRKHGTSDIYPIQLALSDKEGKADFYVSSGTPEHLQNETDWNYGNKSSSLLPPNKAKEIFKWLKFDKKEVVETSTLEKFCIDHNIDEIDFIHMDVQGAELMVLEGAKSKMSNIKVIWMEVENLELYEKQPLKEDVRKYMTNAGFTKFKDTVDFISGDQLWVNLKHFPAKKLAYILSKVFSPKC
jgi:FkbM family methyltransferase